MHIYSFNSVKIEAVSLEPSGQEHLRNASGFVVSYQDQVYLVTNWHVVTGLHFQTNRVLDTETNLRPTKLRVTLPLSSKHDGSEITWHWRVLNDIDLFEDPEYFEGERFIVHPSHGKNIDVIAIPIEYSAFPSGLSPIAIDLNDNIYEDIKLEVMQTLFVIGHPLKSSVTPNKFPIYKNAVISSEPGQYDDLPIILIDGKTKPGMSGSFVVVRPGTEMIDDNPGTTTLVTGRSRLVGVYSGRDRVGDDMHTAELGIMWPIKECLIPILNVNSSTSA